MGPMPQPMMRPSVREDSGEYRALDVLECTVERVTFHNEENGYSVLKVIPSDVRDKMKADVIPVIGNFSNPVVGESLRIQGRWDKHPQHTPPNFACRPRHPRTVAKHRRRLA